MFLNLIKRAGNLLTSSLQQVKEAKCDFLLLALDLSPDFAYSVKTVFFYFA